MQMFDFPKKPLESSICLIYGMSSSIALRTALSKDFQDWDLNYN